MYEWMLQTSMSGCEGALTEISCSYFLMATSSSGKNLMRLSKYFSRPLRIPNRLVSSGFPIATCSRKDLKRKVAYVFGEMNLRTKEINKTEAIAIDNVYSNRHILKCYSAKT